MGGGRGVIKNYISCHLAQFWASHFVCKSLFSLPEPQNLYYNIEMVAYYSITQPEGKFWVYILLSFGKL